MTDGAPGQARRHGALIAWILVIVLATALAVVATLEKSKPTAGNAFQLRMLARQMIGSGGGSLRQLDSVTEGDLAHGLRVACVAAEMDGPEAAHDRLPEIATDPAPEPDDLRAHALLDQLWVDTDDIAETAVRADALSSPDREFVVEHLGWFGELAVLPEGTSRAGERRDLLSSARSATLRAVTIVVLGIGALLAGMLLLALFPLAVGTERTSLHFAPAEGNGGLLAQTFAAWLVLVVVSSTLLSWIFDGSGGLVVGMAPQVIAISALAWPKLRGEAWSDTRRRLGLHSGRGLIRETLCGFASYLMMLPILGIGVAITFGLTRIAESMEASSDATHPIVLMLVEANGLQIVGIFIAGSVIAPLFEETLFRGALYRHLREATGRWTRWLSVPASGMLTGFVFAAIHPQGWLAIPALAAMGFGLTLAREWRNSLIAPIVAHGISNGVVFTALLVMFRS